MPFIPLIQFLSAFLILVGGMWFLMALISWRHGKTTAEMLEQGQTDVLGREAALQSAKDSTESIWQSILLSSVSAMVLFLTAIS